MNTFVKSFQLFWGVVLFVFIFSNCSSSEELTTLKGSKWKLEGIGDTNLDIITELEPIDCKECYTLIFDTEDDFSAHSSTNEMWGNYTANYKTLRIHITNFMGTKMGEIGDGALYYRFFNFIQSFSLQEDELRLHNTNNDKYLLFKKQK